MPLTDPCPADFDPYRSQIHGCYCRQCLEGSYANCPDRRGAATRLLASLVDGMHQRVERAAFEASVEAQRSIDIAAACAAGHSELHMYGMYRGMHGGSITRTFYGEPYSEEFMIGSGIGLTPGHYEAGRAWLDAQRARRDAARATQAASLIGQDPRNACTYSRVSGQVCDHHANKEETCPPQAP